jgi:hypothetical protein
LPTIVKKHDQTSKTHIIKNRQKHTVSNIANSSTGTNTVRGNVYAPRGGPLVKNTVAAAAEKHAKIRTAHMCIIYVKLCIHMNMYVHMCENTYKVWMTNNMQHAQCHL